MDVKGAVLSGYEVADSLHPLDPELGIAWAADTPQVSDRDAAARGLAALRDACSLPG